MTTLQGAGGMDESARLERVYMNSTPRERTAAFKWARATPPSSSPRGKMECHTSLLEALETRFDDVDRAMARKPGAAYVRTQCGLGDADYKVGAIAPRLDFVSRWVVGFAESPLRSLM